MRKRLLNKLNLLVVFIIIIQGIFYVSSSLGYNNAKTMIISSDVKSSEDLVININQNASGIGLSSAIEFSITLQNNGSDRMQNVNADVNTTALNVEISPRTNYQFSDINVEQLVSFNVTLSVTEPDINRGVDLVLIVDASGSMGEEIASVQKELTDLISTLTAEISDLRIGIIVYGWSKYSQFPMSSSNNYMPLTTDFNAIKDMIESLYSNGGTEPWGDALYCTNTWDWRQDAQKLVIVIGDEDCDPGHVIGKDYQSDSWYNGSELLSVVTELKDKGVIISTVVCENPDTFVENQFQWIANYTGGKSVYLPDLEGGENPVTLPKLIQEWTLELSREYSNWFIVEATWSNENGDLLGTSERAHYWMDFSAPSVIYYDKVIAKGSGFFDVQLFAEVRDFSVISNVVIYHNAYDSWTVDLMIYDNATSLYSVSFHDLKEEYNLSFFFEATDSLGNSGVTSEFWIDVGIQSRILGEKTVVQITGGESLVSLFSSPSNMTTFLWFSCPQELITDIVVDLSIQDEDKNNKIPVNNDIVTNQGETSQLSRILEFPLQKQQYLLSLTIPDYYENACQLESVWFSPLLLDNQSVTRNMTDIERTHLYQWTLNEKINLVVDYTPSSDLVVGGKVFYTNWTYIGDFSVTKALELKPGTYFVLVNAQLREGMYRLILTDLVPDIDDRYYAVASTPGFDIVSTLFPLGILVFLLILNRKRGS